MSRLDMEAAADAQPTHDHLGTDEDLKYAAQLMKGEKVYAALRNQCYKTFCAVTDPLYLNKC